VIGQEIERLDSKTLGDALDGPKSQIAFASLYGAHVGAMDTQDVGECFLR
jgi:hypothetical protein